MITLQSTTVLFFFILLFSLISSSLKPSLYQHFKEASHNTKLGCPSTH